MQHIWMPILFFALVLSATSMDFQEPMKAIKEDRCPPVTDKLYGWNGQYRGQHMQAGVFTCFAEVEFIDGFVKMFKGDVTLIK